MPKSPKHLSIKHVKYHSKNKTLSHLLFCAWEISTPHVHVTTKATIYKAWKEGLITLPIDGSVRLTEALDYYERWPGYVLDEIENIKPVPKPSISGA